MFLFCYGVKIYYYTQFIQIIYIKILKLKRSLFQNKIFCSGRFFGGDYSEGDLFLNLHYIFNSFKGANLLTGVNIPFSFRIPISFNPSCLLSFISNSESLSHFFSVEFPLLKVKRALPIVIKSSQNFTSKLDYYKFHIHLMIENQNQNF